LGVLLFAGYSFQTLGLDLGTGPGKTAFITEFYVVLVPIFASFMLKKSPPKLSWLGVVVAFAGIGLLSIDSTSFQFDEIVGDLMVFIGTFGYAFHIIFIDKFVAKEHYSTLTVTQIGTVGILSWIMGGIFWDDSFAFTSSYFTPHIIFAILFTGVIATALIIGAQTFAQKKTSPINVAVIFAMEPVFGAIFGYFRGGELFLPRHWIGCALILVSMIFQQVIDLYINKKPKVTSLKSQLITEESNDDIQLNVDSLPTSDLES